MKNKIDLQMARIRDEGRLGLMTHVIVGYPSLEVTATLVRTMAAAGADFVELQIPFSDPLADGPTIQLACEAAIRRGTRVSDAFDLARDLRKDVTVPLLFMSYFNTVFKYGIERFCDDAHGAGISGLIVPDIPLEADVREGFSAACAKAGLYAIRTVSPLSTNDRLAKNAVAAHGFVYCMTRQGTTGAKSGPSSDIREYLGNVRRHFSVPLAAGFGISGKKRLDEVAPYCDVAVVGSAIIDIVNASEPSEVASNVTAFIDGLETARPREAK